MSIWSDFLDVFKSDRLSRPNYPQSAAQEFQYLPDTKAVETELESVRRRIAVIQDKEAQEGYSSQE